MVDLEDVDIEFESGEGQFAGESALGGGGGDGTTFSSLNGGLNGGRGLGGGLMEEEEEASLRVRTAKERA